MNEGVSWLIKAALQGEKEAQAQLKKMHIQYDAQGNLQQPD